MRLRLPELNLPVGRKRQPEDSVALRAWVLAAILVGEVAVLTSGYFDPATGILVPLLTVVAFVVSHRQRREKNFFIKVMLAFAALAALAVFQGGAYVVVRHAGAAREAVPLATGHTRLRSARA